MDLDQISISLRPRKGWEAVDLGLRLSREHWRAVFLPMALLVAVLGGLLMLLTPYEELSWLPTWILWWLKPLYDRMGLFVLSRAVFGQVPSFRDVFRNMPSFLMQGLFLDLTFRRLQFSRAFVLPVRMLEGLIGQRRSQRIQSLQAGAGGLPAGFQIVWIHMEIVLTLAVMSSSLLLVPVDLMENMFEVFLSADKELLYVYILIYMVVMVFLEGFYIGGSFGLYLNRRAHLEGWDIELSFRRLERRLEREHVAPIQAMDLNLKQVDLDQMDTLSVESSAKKADHDQSNSGGGSLSASLALLCGSMLMAGALLHCVPAQADEAKEAPKSEYQQQIRDILDSEEFRDTKEVVSYRFDFENKDEDKEEDSTLDPDLKAFFKALGLIAEVIVWLALAVLIVLLVMNRDRFRSVINRWRGVEEESIPMPGTMFGLDLRPESLPDDVAGQALALWRAGKQREGLALLYRGSLVAVMSRHPLRVPSSATEGDVLRLCHASLGADDFNFLRKLTHAWQALAYAHRTPTDEAMESLSGEWPQRFRADTAEGGA